MLFYCVQVSCGQSPAKDEEMTVTPECSHPRFDSLLGSKYNYFYTQEVLADQ